MLIMKRLKKEFLESQRKGEPHDSETGTELQVEATCEISSTRLLHGGMEWSKTRSGGVGSGTVL